MTNFYRGEDYRFRRDYDDRDRRRRPHYPYLPYYPYYPYYPFYPYNPFYPFNPYYRYNPRYPNYRY